MPNGRLATVGNSTANTGTAKIKLELWGLNNAAKSPVFNIIIVDARNVAHSKVMFVKLVMPILAP